MKKRFYCADCGEPVPEKARKCTHCGSIFTAVRCPKCSFEGKGELFESGCPACGYLVAGGGEVSASPRAQAAGHQSTRGISPWFARIVGIVLLAVITMLVYLILRG